MDQSALENILKKHHRDAYLWARQCCSFDDDLAKDTLQNVYLKILEGKAKFKEKSSVKTWLFAVIRYTAIDQKNTDRNTQPLEVIPEIEDLPLAMEEEVNYKQLIQLLSPMQKEVILMVFYHEMTLEQSAEVLQLSIGTVRTHYDRGKKRLKQLILKTQTTY